MIEEIVSKVAGVWHLRALWMDEMSWVGIEKRRYKRRRSKREGENKGGVSELE